MHRLHVQVADRDAQRCRAGLLQSCRPGRIAAIRDLEMGYARRQIDIKKTEWFGRCAHVHVRVLVHVHVHACDIVYVQRCLYAQESHMCTISPNDCPVYI